MKKLLALIVVLGLASAAQAGFVISVNGVVDPADSTVFAAPSDLINLDIHGVGNDDGNVDVILLSTGNIDFSNTSILSGTDSGQIIFTPVDLGGTGYATGAQISIASLSATLPNLTGLLVDNMILHVDGQIGDDIVIDLWDGTFSNILDSQVIHITPEPMTMSLLALGGLGLIRRRRRA